MFIAGNDGDAKRKVGAMLKDFGWGVVDVGGIESSRYLEAMCMVWVLSAIRTNNWNQAFKLLQEVKGQTHDRKQQDQLGGRTVDSIGGPALMLLSSRRPGGDGGLGTSCFDRH